MSFTRTLPSAQELAPYVEWGGPVWVAQVERGLRWLGGVRGATVLDLGCRFGGMTILFARLGATVTGVDVDRRVVDEARLRADAAGVGRSTRFECRSGDPEDLPRGFDIVFAKSVLVLSPDLSSSVLGIAHALNPGGRTLVIENARGPLPIHLARMIRRRSLRPHGATYFTPGTVDILRRDFAITLEHWSAMPPTVVLGGQVRPTAR